MKTYTSLEQVEKDIKRGVLAVNDDIEIAFDGFSIDADIRCHNIYSKEYPRNIKAKDIDAGNISARDINAWDIDAGNISARDINAWDINAGNIGVGNISAVDIDAGNISAVDIDAGNISAKDIDAWNISAKDIDAGNIRYFDVCYAYSNIVCTSIKGRRRNAKHFALDGKVTIKE